jgi:hypothetical protein
MKSMQVAVGADDLGTGSQHQVEGVAEQDLVRRLARSSSGVMALTVPSRADRHEGMGVSIVPLGSRKRPRRAAPSVARTSNFPVLTGAGSAVESFIVSDHAGRATVLLLLDQLKG